MLTKKRKLGNLGEKIACKFLTKKGYSILKTNYQKRTGEIDIVAKLGETIHFIETKTRTKHSIEKFGVPQEAVNSRKQIKLIRTALYYLSENKYSDDTNWQIDVVAITIDKSKKTAKINYIENAVNYNDVCNKIHRNLCCTA